MSSRPILLRKNGIALIPLHITTGFVLSLYFTFLPLHIYELFGFIASSLCRSLVAATSISLSWLWGWFSDVSSSKKRLLTLSMTGQAVFTMVFVLSPLLKNTGFLHLLFLLAIYAIASLFTSLFYPVKNAVITLLTTQKERGKGVGSFFLFSSIGWGIGGYLIGYWLSVLSFALTVFLVSVFHLCSVLFFSLVFEEKEIKTKPPIKRGLFQSLKKMNPILQYITLSIILISVGRGIFLPIFQIKMWIFFDKQSLWVGIITGLSGVAGAVGSYLYGSLSDHIGKTAALTLGIIGNFALLLMAILSQPITIALVWIFPIWPLIAVSSVALAADYSEETRRGEAQGIIRSARSFSGLFSVVGGIIATLLRAEEQISRLNPFFLTLCIFPALALLPLWKSRTLTHASS